MADLFIIGQFEGVAALLAVTIGSQVMHMITVMLVGLAMGTTVSIGQAIGSKDKKRVAEGIGNTVILFMGVALVCDCAALLIKTNCNSNVYTTGSSNGNDILSYHLLYRDSFYYSI